MERFSKFMCIPYPQFIGQPLFYPAENLDHEFDLKRFSSRIFNLDKLCKKICKPVLQPNSTGA
jgi:hypothetical protein